MLPCWGAWCLHIYDAAGALLIMIESQAYIKGRLPDQGHICRFPWKVRKYHDAVKAKYTALSAATTISTTADRMASAAYWDCLWVQRRVPVYGWHYRAY